MKISIHRVNEVVFKLFCLSIFFVYYQVMYIPGTIHTLLMIFGCVLIFPYMVKRYSLGLSLPFDYLMIICMLLVIIIGAILSYPLSSWIKVQAYILMLVTYVYVKESVTGLTLSFLYKVIRYFLLINGILIIVQTFTGSYFPARYFASGSPPLLIASGVSDGPTKNGMLISFALSVVFGNFIFRHFKFSLFDMLVFGIGIISLFLSVSRAGMLSFAIVVLFCVIFFLIPGILSRQYRFSFSRIFTCLFILVVVIGCIVYFNIGLQTLYNLRDSSIDDYGIRALMYKLTVISDDSLGERFDTLRHAYELSIQSPMQTFTFGFGVGTFEQIYGLNVHNSYAELVFSTGFIGALIFVSLLANVLLKCFLRRDAIIIMPIFLALIAIMSFMFVHDVLRGRIFWIALGTMAAFAYKGSRYSSSLSSTSNL